MKKLLLTTLAAAAIGAQAQNFWPRNEAYSISSSTAHSFATNAGPTTITTLSYAWERCQTAGLTTVTCTNWAAVPAAGHGALNTATLTINANTITGNQRWNYRRCSTNSACTNAALNRQCTPAVDIIFY